MNKIDFTPLEAIVFTAVQACSTDKSLQYVKRGEETQTRGEALVQLVQEAANRSTATEQKRTLLRSIEIIQDALQSSRSGKCAMAIKQVWWKLFGSEYAAKMQKSVNDDQEALNVLDKKATDLRETGSDYRSGYYGDISTDNHLEAFVKFNSEYRKRFGATPKPLKGGEIKEYLTVSKWIWNSQLVEQYVDYASLMEEDAIGSHMLFTNSTAYDRDPNVSLYDKIKDNVGCGGKGQIETRISSHYGNIGSEQQSHIRGSRFPETLFFKGNISKFGPEIIQGTFDKAGKATLTKEGGKALYWEQIPEETCFYYRQVPVTWRQRERTPDGPDWSSWLQHRIVDFVLYQVLKRVKPERPQVASFVSKTLGRGVPDTNPIFVEYSDYKWSQDYPAPTATSKTWTVRDEYLRV